MSAPIILAEFDTPERLVLAATRLRALGYKDLDAFTPYPLPELDPILRIERSKIPRWVLFFGLCGGTFAYVFQWWMTAVDYPLDVGGRPLHSAPAFVPITFETCVLFGAFAALIAFFVYCGLPRLWDPVFEIAGFERASIDRFFLAVGPDNVGLSAAEITTELGAGALRVIDVAAERAR